MEKYAEVSVDQKQTILEEYQPGVRGKGFKALAKRHSINGGHTTIRKWYKTWMEQRIPYRKRVEAIDIAF